MSNWKELFKQQTKDVVNDENFVIPSFGKFFEPGTYEVYVEGVEESANANGYMLLLKSNEGKQIRMFLSPITREGKISTYFLRQLASLFSEPCLVQKFLGVMGNNPDIIQALRGYKLKITIEKGAGYDLQKTPEGYKIVDAKTRTSMWEDVFTTPEEANNYVEVYNATLTDTSLAIKRSFPDISSITCSDFVQDNINALHKLLESKNEKQNVSAPQPTGTPTVQNPNPKSPAAGVTTIPAPKVI